MQEKQNLKERTNSSYTRLPDPSIDTVSNPASLALFALGNDKGVGRNSRKNFLTGMGPINDNSIPWSVFP